MTCELSNQPEHGSFKLCLMSFRWYYFTKEDKERPIWYFDFKMNFDLESLKFIWCRSVRSYCLIIYASNCMSHTVNCKLEFDSDIFDREKCGSDRKIQSWLKVYDPGIDIARSLNLKYKIQKLKGNDDFVESSRSFDNKSTQARNFDIWSKRSFNFESTIVNFTNWRSLLFL